MLKEELCSHEELSSIRKMRRGCCGSEMRSVRLLDSPVEGGIAPFSLS